MDRILILVIDAGTTAFKAVVFDSELNQVSAGSSEYPVKTPAPDQSELEESSYYGAMVASIKAAVETVPAGPGVPAAPGQANGRSAGQKRLPVASRIRPEQVKAVAVCSHTDTLFPVDDQGRTVRNPIFWVDGRAGREARNITETLGQKAIFRKTGQTGIANVHFASKIAWMAKHEKARARETRYFLQVQDYLVHRLCGETVLDRSIGGSSGLVDIRTGNYWGEMLALIGVTTSKLPRLVDPGSIAGVLSSRAAQETGLKAGTPVICGAMDAIAAAVAAGNVKPNMISEAAGAALVLCATTDRLVFDRRRRIPCFLHALPGKYLLMPWSETGGMALKWYRDGFWRLEAEQEKRAGRSVYELICREAEATPPGADGLIFLPFLAGSGSPDFDVEAKGALYGLRLNHTRAHVSRAVLEGVAFMLKRNLDALRDLGCQARCLHSSGGGSRSAVWCQIKSDITGVTLRTSDLKEEAALGAAMLGTVALGWYPDVASAMSRLASEHKLFRPRKRLAALYQVKYETYDQLVKALRPVFHAEPKPGTGSKRTAT